MYWQAKLTELENVREVLEKVKSDLHSTETAKGWLERRLNEAEVRPQDYKSQRSWLVKGNMLGLMQAYYKATAVLLV